MVQCLRVLAALVEDPGSVLSVRIRHFTTTLNSFSGHWTPCLLLCSLGIECLSSYTYADTHIYLSKHLKNEIKMFSFLILAVMNQFSHFSSKSWLSHKCVKIDYLLILDCEVMYMAMTTITISSSLLEGLLCYPISDSRMCQTESS